MLLLIGYFFLKRGRTYPKEGRRGRLDGPIGILSIEPEVNSEVSLDAVTSTEIEGTAATKSLPSMNWKVMNWKER